MTRRISILFTLFFVAVQTHIVPLSYAEVSRIVIGRGHTCVLMSGEVKCWGSNSLGQLGDGTATARSMPTDVIGLPDTVDDIIAGGASTCALAQGAVWCWGVQDGTISLTPRPVPALVSGLESGVSSIGAGDMHSCASTAEGAKCWGYNYWGQLGDGAADLHPPHLRPVTGLLDPVSVFVGDQETTCALVSGRVKCWGGVAPFGPENYCVVHSLVPVDMAGLSEGVTSIAQGDSFLCATVSGAVKCLGDNQHGQLGNGTTTSSLSAVDVLGLQGGVTLVASGGAHACALVSGGAKCWGSNMEGELGANIFDNMSTSPVDVVGLGDSVSLLSTGLGSHSCAVLASGEIKCWGSNHFGQLGNGTTEESHVPVTVVFPTPTPTALPTPPAGIVGVSIDNGALYATSIDVTLHVVYPPETASITVSNDGGFGTAETFPTQQEIPWQLRSSGSERLPRIVYVRFGSDSQTFSDDIILDETAPRIAAAVARRLGHGGRMTVTVQASDRTSGVSKMQIVRGRKILKDWVSYKRKLTVVADGKMPLYAKVKDAAGNISKRKKVVVR